VNVVFDFGGVLFNWEPEQLIQASFPERAATPAQWQQLTQAIFGHAQWHDYDRGVSSVAEVSARTAQRLGLDATAMHALVDSIGERLAPIPQTLALLAQLCALRDASGAALRLYYLSNMPVPYARTLERKHPFIGWFDGGIFSGDVQRIKPEPEIYELLEKRHQLEPGQTVFIDDQPGNVQQAQARGWHGINFRSAPQLQEQLQRMLNPPLTA